VSDEGQDRRSSDGESGEGSEPRSGAKTQRERAEARRQEKLDLIQEQIDEGTLTIRQMTPEERKKHPPRPREPKRRK
jgi:hypothetical protein